jgi:hypothetical protein
MTTVTILVKNAFNLQTVADELVKKGFVLENTLDIVRILTGTVLEEKIEELKAVAGVESVEISTNKFTC